MELSVAYTPEISDYKEANILSVKPIGSDIVVELQIIYSSGLPNEPSDKWSSIKAIPTYYYDDYEDQERRGKFEIDPDEDIIIEQDHDPIRPLIIEWSALIDVKTVN